MLSSMRLKRRIDRLAVRFLVRPYVASRKVPIVAITGTNGKTTTTRLLEKIYLNAGFNVGSCSTYGVSHNGVQVSDQDDSNARGAWRAARCRDLDLLILETARGGLISYGLGFRTCHVSIVTNLHADHLGFDGVHTLAGMAEVKGLLPRNTASNGVVVLNGDDPLVKAMAGHSTASPVYFVLESDPERYEHVWWVRDGWITRRVGGHTMKVIRAIDIPIVSGGLQRYNTANVMAVLAAIEGLRNFISVPDDVVRRTLMEFGRNPYDNIGKFHSFRYRGQEMLWVDTKNPASAIHTAELIRVVQRERSCQHCVGLLTAPGNRNDMHYQGISRTLEPVCDAFVIHPPSARYLRGRDGPDVVRLLSTHIPSDKLLSNRTLTLDEFIATGTDAMPGKILFVVLSGDQETIDLRELFQQAGVEADVSSYLPSAGSLDDTARPG